MDSSESALDEVGTAPKSRVQARRGVMLPRLSDLLADRQIFGSKAMMWDASAINGYVSSEFVAT